MIARNLYIKRHYEYTHNIIQAVYERTKNLREKEKNFSIITANSYGDKNEFYYKDGKYKDDNIYNDSFDDGTSGYINYGVETGDGKSYVLQL